MYYVAAFVIISLHSIVFAIVRFYEENTMAELVTCGVLVGAVFKS